MEGMGVSTTVRVKAVICNISQVTAKDTALKCSQTVSPVDLGVDAQRTQSY